MSARGLAGDDDSLLVALRAAQFDITGVLAAIRNIAHRYDEIARAVAATPTRVSLEQLRFEGEAAELLMNSMRLFVNDADVQFGCSEGLYAYSEVLLSAVTGVEAEGPAMRRLSGAAAAAAASDGGGLRGGARRGAAARVVSRGAVALLADALCARPGDEALQLYGLRAIANLLSTDEPVATRSIAAAQGAVRATLRALSAHRGTSEHIVATACTLLGSISPDPDARRRIVRGGGVQSVLAAMRANSGSDLVQWTALRALEEIVAGTTAAAAAAVVAGTPAPGGADAGPLDELSATAAGCVRDVVVQAVEATCAHMGCMDVLAFGAGVLYEVSRDERAADTIIEAGGVACALGVVHLCRGAGGPRGRVQEAAGAAIGALAQVAGAHAEARAHVLLDTPGVVPAALRAMAEHADSIFVGTCGCVLIACAMAVPDRAADDVVAGGAGTLVLSALRANIRSGDATAAGVLALASLLDETPQSAAAAGGGRGGAAAAAAAAAAPVSTPGSPGDGHRRGEQLLIQRGSRRGRGGGGSGRVGPDGSTLLWSSHSMSGDMDSVDSGAPMEDLIDVAVLAMRAHPGRGDVARHACEVLYKVSELADDGAPERTAAAVINAMRAHDDNWEVALYGCRVIANLCGRGAAVLPAGVASLVLGGGALPVMVGALTRFGQREALLLNALAALACVAADGGVARELASRGAAASVVAARRAFPRNAHVAHAGCRALAAVFAAARHGEAPPAAPRDTEAGRSRSTTVSEGGISLRDEVCCGENIAAVLATVGAHSSGSGGAAAAGVAALCEAARAWRDGSDEAPAALVRDAPAAVVRAAATTWSPSLASAAAQCLAALLAVSPAVGAALARNEEALDALRHAGAVGADDAECVAAAQGAAAAIVARRSK